MDFLPHIDAGTIVSAVIVLSGWIIAAWSERLGKNQKVVPNSVQDYVVTFIRGGVAAVKAKQPALLSKVEGLIEPRVEAKVAELMQDNRKEEGELQMPGMLTTNSPRSADEASVAAVDSGQPRTALEADQERLTPGRGEN